MKVLVRFLFGLTTTISMCSALFGCGNPDRDAESSGSEIASSGTGSRVSWGLSSCSPAPTCDAYAGCFNESASARAQNVRILRVTSAIRYTQNNKEVLQCGLTFRSGNTGAVWSAGHKVHKKW